MKNLYSIILGTSLILCISTQATAGNCTKNTNSPCSKDSFAQGESVEFFNINKMAGDKNVPVNNLFKTLDGKFIKIDACSNVIAEIVNNNNDESIEGGYLVKVRPPRLDRFSPFAEYDCFYKKTSDEKVSGSKIEVDAAGDRNINSDNDMRLLVKSEDLGSAGKLYRMNPEVAAAIPHVEVGMTYGIMVIPFKRYVGGGGLKDGGTVGAYLGYKQFFPEHSYSFTPVLAFGYANQKYDAVDSTTSNIKEFTAGMLSIAAGATWGFSYDRFKIGLLYGMDDRSSNDINSPSFRGKWWSVMFGIGLEPSKPSIP